MKKVRVEDALGMILAHDITEVIPQKKKDVAFSRGKVIEQGDIERLLDLGKRNLFVFDDEVTGVHEEDGGRRIAKAVADECMELLPPKEGKVNIVSKVDGLFYVDEKHLYEMNRVKDILLSTLPNRHPVKRGDVVAAAKTIPLYIDEDNLKKAEEVAKKQIISIRPFRTFKVGLVITGSEVYTGRIKDGSEVVENKIKGYGLEVMGKIIVPDSIPEIRDAIVTLIRDGAEVVITTAGLSVDPDDVTKEGIEATGARVVFYGTPVFPGAMFLMAKLKDKYVLGAPACVYYNNNTVLDMVLPRLMAGEPVRKRDIAKLSYGGLCLHCDVCHYPRCFFGKGP